MRLSTRVVDGRGADRLETLTLEGVETGRREEAAAAAVFVLIGAEPRTEWLRDSVQPDDCGYILIGRDVPLQAWPLERPPLPFETSMPGVFAVGDARHGSVKRVAGAVGEGSVAVGSVHQYLAALEGERGLQSGKLRLRGYGACGPREKLSSFLGGAAPCQTSRFGEKP